MSYCTLEEAWGDDYNSTIKENLKKQKKYKKNINNNIYNKSGQDIYHTRYKQKQQDNRHRFAFSRGTNRLDMHNGPKRRVNLKKIDLPYPIDGNDAYYHGKNCFGKQMTNADYDEMYQDDLPEFKDTEINEENDNDIIYNDISDEEDNLNLEETNSDLNENYENNVQENPLLNKLNKLIEKIDLLVLNNSNNESTPNYNDLFLFIFTGILIICVMDMFVRFGQKMK